MLDALDTIAAVASAPGGGVRGIVRVSGPQALACVMPLVIDVDRRAALGLVKTATSVPATLRLPYFAAPVPCDLFVWPDARSYTRAPTVELHLPGSPPIVEAAVAAVCSHGARPAKPGEYTLRAFLAGRLDLTQAEAVLGVIDAADRRQLDAALEQLAGGLARPLGVLRGDLLDLLAELEAGLDFVEEDIEFIARGELIRRLHAAKAAVGELQTKLDHRAAAGVLPRVVLVGAPNAGKSSLFNALVGKHAALVSPVAGTTRDYLTAELSLGGTMLQLVDTAGLAAAAIDDLDAVAQRAGAEQTRGATLTVVCCDSTVIDLAAMPPDDVTSRLNGERLVVRTKSDLSPAATTSDVAGDERLHVSAATGEGLDRLTAAIAARLRSSAAGDVVASTAVRCRDSLARARRALTTALAVAEQKHGEELIAAEVRLALDELGQILGAVYTDDILDRIFGRFCIGK
jgi:tRNA modification GTPase